MKLDEKLIQRIHEASAVDYEIFEEFLRGLDLVFKPGDSSQSVLVDSRDFNRAVFKDEDEV